ncbi:MAG: DUF6090 family protein [Flavobacteriaceae bacterium]|nr:DUF6090 family protein [Flavobacteriaceae bacterium]
MIKIFRNIRKTLVGDNRTSKYLLYAIGEIILVVIGILIALQINNWNEGRKAALYERQLLDNLRGEFEDNLRDLDSIAKEVDTVLVALEKVFGLFSPNPELRLQDSLDTYLSQALSSPNWKPSDYLLNNLNNSGTIAELQNENLKLLLYKWARQRKEMIEVHERTERTGEEIITYLKSYGSLRNVDVSSPGFKYPKSLIFRTNLGLLSDPRFENQIDDKLYMYMTTKNWLQQARTTLSELIEETKK